MVTSPDRLRYTPQTVETILNEIRQSGIEKLGYMSAAVPKATYMRWKRDKHEFKEQVAVALAEFRKEKAPEIKATVERAKRYLTDTLNGTEYQEVIEEKLGSNGAVIEKITKRKRILPPDWYLRRLMDESENTQQELKVQVTIAQPPQLTSEQIEAEESRWIDEDQEEYDDEFDEEDGTD